MSAKYVHNPLTAENFYAVEAAVCKQTIAESQLEYSIYMGAVTVHHGTRYGSPIVIVEHHDQQADELSGIWFDERQQ